MAYTLFDLLVDVYSELGKITISQATGGSTTTIVDTYLSKDTANDTWKGGAFFVVSTTDGEAPQGSFGLITTSSATAQSFTFATLAAAIEAGDRYGYTSQEYPLYQVVQDCNRAIRDLGQLPLADTSLTVVTGQTEYALPVALKHKPPLQVWVATDDDSDNQGWKEIRDYSVDPAGPGSTGLLIMPNDDNAGKTIKLLYLGSHPELRDSTDIVSEYIDPALAKWAATKATLSWQNGRTGYTNRGVLGHLETADAELQIAKRIYRIWKPKLHPKLKRVWYA